jgi:hypothetical protein
VTDVKTRSLAMTVIIGLLLATAVQGLAVWYRVQVGRERIETSRYIVGHSCTNLPHDPRTGLPKQLGLCYVFGWDMDEIDRRFANLASSSDGWKGSRDANGFPVASEEAKRMTAAKCPDANPLWVEAHGKCPPLR